MRCIKSLINENKSLHGLAVENRLVFDKLNEAPKSGSSETPKIEAKPLTEEQRNKVRREELVTREKTAQAKTAEAGTKAQMDLMREEMTNIEKRVNSYNSSRYVAEDFESKNYSMFGDSNAKKKERPQEQPLKLDPRNPQALIDQIEGILNAPFTYKEKEYPNVRGYLAQVMEDRKDQPAELIKIQGQLKTYLNLQGHLGNLEAAKNAVAAGNLVKRVDDGLRKREVSKALEEGGRMNMASVMMDRVVENPVWDDEDFKDFWKNPTGELESQRLNENRNLFLSILAKQTNDFAPGKFILGEEFGPYPTQNIQNFPFIYQEWSKKHAKEDPGLAQKGEKLKAKSGEFTRGETINNIDEKIKETLDNERLTDLNLSFTVAQSDPNESETTNWGDNKLNSAKYYGEVAQKAEDVVSALGKEQRRLDKSTQAERISSIEKAIKDIEPYIEWAKMAGDYRRSLDKSASSKEKFTRKELEKDAQFTMELAMRQYMRAMSIVDQSSGDYKTSTQSLKNPGVRRALIAMVYREGVSIYEKGENGKGKVVDASNGFNWMISELAQSPYFNSLNRGWSIDTEQRDFLLIARYANVAFNKENNQRQNIGTLESLLKEIEEKKGDAKAQEEIDEKIKEWSKVIPGTDENTPLSRGNLSVVIQREKGELDRWVNLRNQCHELMMAKPKDGKVTDEFKDEMRKKIGDFIKSMKSGPYDNLVQGDTNTTRIEGYANWAAGVNLTYDAINLKERTRDNYLELMGINPEGFYLSYQNYCNDHKDLNMKVENWDDCLLESGDINKLIDMFEATLSKNMKSGKEDFIAVMRTLHGKSRMDIKPDSKDGQARAFDLYAALKAEIRGRETVADSTAHGAAELKSRIKGMTWADKATEYAKSVFDMIWGSGQSPANMAAGATICYAAFRVLKYGFSKETKDKFWAKALRYAGLTAAVELMIKHVTGAGVLDRLKLTGVADAMKGTYENVMLKWGDKWMNEKGVTGDEHTRALYEMKNVPFKDLLRWYNSTTDAGLGGEKLPRGISVSSFVRGMKLTEENKEVRARFVLKQTMRNFFDYVGHKNQRDAIFGAKALEERWVKAVEKKNYTLADTYKTEFEFPREELVKWAKKNPRGLTWEIVMHNEILMEDVDAANNGSLFNRMKEAAKSAVNVAVAKVRTDIYYPTVREGQELWDKMGDRYAPWLKDKLSDGLDSAEAKIKYGKDQVELWYNANESVIIRFANNHWELVKAGARLPLEALYAIDNWVVPRVVMGAKRLEEVLRAGEYSKTSRGDLNIHDLLGDGMFKTKEIDKKKVITNEIDRKKLETDDNVFGTKENEKSRFFGYFTRSFVSAFENAKNDQEIKEGKAFYEDSESNENGRLSGVDYLITAVDQKDIGEDPSNPRPNADINEIQSRMVIKSREKAMRQFKENYAKQPPTDKPQLTDEMLEKYMGSVHRIVKASPGTAGIDKLYVFWRMPRPDSWEYKLKEEGRWPNLDDPNAMKDSIPFIVNPNLGLTENLEAAFGINMYGTRRLAGYPLMIFSQWLRAANFVIGNTMGIAHTVVGGVGSFIPGFKPRSIEWMTKFTELSAEKKEWVDEFMESGSDPSLALSDYYKEETNAKIYAWSNYASKKTGDKLYLGKLGKRKNDKDYNKPPVDMVRWEHFYEEAQRLKIDQ